MAADILHRSLPDLPISLSSDILPEYREYERTATTVINAYLLPLVGRYLQRLTGKLVDLPVRVMQSNGGAIGTTQAAREPARLVLSGPAGGVVGAFRLAQLAGQEDSPRIITFDMGGTSTDVALCPGIVPRTAESEVAGLPLRLPVIDIHTVGAGGGSPCARGRRRRPARWTRKRRRSAPGPSATHAAAINPPSPMPILSSDAWTPASFSAAAAPCN